jgi:hypothetical protein
VFKNSVRIFVEKIHKMGCLEGSGVPVLYIGRTEGKLIKYLYEEYTRIISLYIMHSLVL